MVSSNSLTEMGGASKSRDTLGDSILLTFLLLKPGYVGGSVLWRLLQTNAYNIRAIVRDPTKAKIFKEQFDVDARARFDTLSAYLSPLPSYRTLFSPTYILARSEFTRRECKPIVLVS